MFDNNCQVCASRVLIFPSQVTSLANTDDGIVVSFTCWCGTEQTQVTGKAARADRDPRRRLSQAPSALGDLVPESLVAEAVRGWSQALRG